MDDSAILTMFQERSEQAITETATKYGYLCKTIAKNVLENDEDVKECMNDVYLALWNAIPPQQPDPLSAYIGKMTRNLALKRYHLNTAKKRNRTYDVTLDEFCECFPAPLNVEDEVLTMELTKALNCFLAQCNTSERIIFIRRFWYCDTTSTIAARMKMRENTVTVQLHRTKRKLKKYLQKEGYTI